MPAQLVRVEDDGDGIRVAVIRCPLCGALHRHCVPCSVLPSARPPRTAACHGARGEYELHLGAQVASTQPNNQEDA
jgi:hypothetical protein